MINLYKIPEMIKLQRQNNDGWRTEIALRRSGYKYKAI